MIASPSPSSTACSSSFQGSAWIWHLSVMPSSAQMARARSTLNPEIRPVESMKLNGGKSIVVRNRSRVTALRSGRVSRSFASQK